MKPRPRCWLSALVACAVGAALTVAYPWVLVVPSISVMVTLLPLIQVSVGGGFWLVGVCWGLYGMALAGTAYSGVHADYGLLLAALPVALTGAAFFVTGVLFRLFRPAIPSAQVVWFFPVAFLAAEASVSPQVVWGTFSVIAASVSTVASGSPFLQAAPWSGPGGITFLVALSNVALYVLVTRPQRWRAALILLGIGLLVALPKVLYPPESRVSQRLALVQGRVSNARYQAALEDAGARAEILHHYRELHRHAAALEPDLIVYPEGNLPGIHEPGEWAYLREMVAGGPPTMLGTLLGEPLAARRLHGRVRQVQSYQYGALSVQPYRRLVNVALLWNGLDFTVAYEKRALFPFGETYNPGRFLPPTRLGGMTLGVLICYDNTMPAQVLERVRHGATLLLVMANTNFASGSTMPRGHLMVSQLMAASTRRALVHVSQSGPSALVGPSGELIAQLPEGVADVGVGDAPIVGVMTPYARFGDWVASACLIGFLLLVLAWSLYRIAGRRQAEVSFA